MKAEKSVDFNNMITKYIRQQRVFFALCCMILFASCSRSLMDEGYQGGLISDRTSQYAFHPQNNFGQSWETKNDKELIYKQNYSERGKYSDTQKFLMNFYKHLFSQKRDWEKFNRKYFQRCSDEMQHAITTFQNSHTDMEGGGWNLFTSSVQNNLKRTVSISPYRHNWYTVEITAYDRITLRIRAEKINEKVRITGVQNPKYNISIK